MGNRPLGIARHPSAVSDVKLETGDSILFTFPGSFYVDIILTILISTRTAFSINVRKVHSSLPDGNMKLRQGHGGRLGTTPVLTALKQKVVRVDIKGSNSENCAAH